MTNVLRVAGWAVAAVILAGCATMTVNTITNLTPSRLPRKDNGQYMFSVAFDSRQRTILKESIQASVLIGERVYAMERTPLVPSRWETLVPVPGDQEVVNYRFRLQYDYKAIPDIRTMVVDSKDYQLRFDPPW